MKHKVLILASILFAIILSACDTGTTSLPTLAVLPTQTEGTVEVAAPTLTESPVESAEVTATAEAAETAVPTTVPSATPFIVPASADQNATQAALVAPNLTPAATTDIATLVGSVDLSSVAAGDTISLIGTLTITNTVVEVIDSAGSHVILDTPAPMVEAMAGLQVYVVGVVTATGQSVSLQVLTLQEMVETQPGAEITVPAFDVAATADATANVLPVTTLDMRLEASLTALDAFDQLVGQLGAQLGSRVWITASGNPAAGWSFGFYDETDASVVIYAVLADGTVMIQPGIPPLGVTEVFALDRESLTVDSDAVLTAYAANGGSDAPDTLVLLLQAPTDESAQWAVLDVEGVTRLKLDAVSGDVVP